MKSSLLVLCSTLVLASCSTPTPHYKSIAELKAAGHYGRVHHWKEHNKKPHDITVKMPANASIIVSDFHSRIGANGLPRGGGHRGMDIYHDTGTPIIAAADGVVKKAETGSCWGPTVLIYHGKTEAGKPLYGLYSHMQNISVKVGQKVKRGEQIAEMGPDIFNSCGGGMHHLHFQASHDPDGIPIGWGWSYFVGDGWNAPNPHKFWANGPGQVTCYEPGRKYKDGTFTFPLRCDGGNQKKPVLLTKLSKPAPQPETAEKVATKSN
jgi:murein DD-endopeptidase MepM/ murein hydrolase activator NlpD